MPQAPWSPPLPLAALRRPTGSARGILWVGRFCALEGARTLTTAEGEGHVSSGLRREMGDRGRLYTATSKVVCFKLVRSHGGCPGARSRGRALATAIAPGSRLAGCDPGVPEWGNPAGVMPSHPALNP